MVLLNELENKDKKSIVDAFIKSRDIKVKRVTYFCDDDYGSGINIYIAKKDERYSDMETFLGLWLKNAIWEEEMEEFDYSNERCEYLYDEIFKYVVFDYNIKPLAVNEAMSYLVSKINAEIKKINDVSLDKRNDLDIGFLDVSGIYVNKKYTNTMPTIISKDDKIISAVELMQNSTYDEYREIFIETNQRYIYFF